LERTMVYETGSLLADNFRGLDESLLRVERDINLSIGEGVDQVNRLTSKLALFNHEILNLGQPDPPMISRIREIWSLKNYPGI
jgi:flagellar hook-associated protein FlgK